MVNTPQRASAVTYVVAAALTVIAGLIIGGFLFQVSSLAFDYMKLRKLPLYGSASSLARFSKELETIAREMGPQTVQIRALLRDRATIDIEIAEKNAEAASTLSEARTLLRPVRTVELTFRSIDAAFSQLCPAVDNVAAANQVAEITADTTPTAVVPTPPSPDAASPAPKMTEQQQSIIKQACAIGTESCEAAPTTPRGVRLRMICAQKALQAAERRKGAINAYNFDGARYFTDALRITYPSFGTDEVADAVRVVEIYQTTVHGIGGSREACDPPAPAPKAVNAAAGALSPANTSCTPVKTFRAGFWDWWLAWPLAILYLALAFVSGLVGSLSRYLYGFAAPIQSPTDNPFAPIIAGGGAAILAVMIVLGGFQFLTVGASSPDLAYPNPLTVCGLSVLSGLAGERVLAALQGVVGRIFGVGASPSPPPPPTPTPG